MKKQHKHFGLTLNIHPIHFHLSMYVALAMIALTAGKGSEHLLKSSYGTDHSVSVNEQAEMREAEVHRADPNLTTLRVVTSGGN